MTVLTAALAFCEAGAAVVPAAIDGTKKPNEVWSVWQHQRADAAQIQRWLGAGWPSFGIVCGSVSGNLEMLELEATAVPLLQQIVKLAEAAGLGVLLRRLSAGYMESSPTGGLHWLYRVEGGRVSGNTKLARRPATPEELAVAPDDRIKTLIETRGEGGYTIVAPSNGATHPTGRPWVLLAGEPATIPTITASERDELFRVMRTFDRLPKPQPSGKPAGGGFTQPGSGAGSDTLSPGNDYASRTSWADILAPADWVQVYVRDGVTYWRRPGKRIGVSASTGHGAGDWLWVWSTSTIFESERTYTKFGAYATLYHRSDHTEAATALRARGYGAPKATTTPVGIPDPDEVEDERLWPTLHPAAFQGLAGVIVDNLAPFTEADPVGVLVTVLALFGAYTQPTAHVWAGDVEHGARVWPLLVGATAGGLKGSAWQIAKRVAQSADPIFAAENIDSGLTSGEGLIERIRDADGPEVKKDPHPGVHDKRLLVIESEFAAVLARAGREGNTLSTVMRQAWDGDDLRTMSRRSNRLRATRPHVVLVGHVTPRELVLRLTESDVAGGTMNRFLPVLVRRSKRLPMGGGAPPELITDLGRDFRDAGRFAWARHRMLRSTEADAWWCDEVYTELTPDSVSEGPVAMVIARAAPQVLRLAMLYALLDSSPSVELVHLRAAVELWRYVVASCGHIFGGSTGNPNLDKVIKAIGDAGPAGMTRQEIRRDVFNRNLPADQIDALLRQLVTLGYHEEVLPAAGGHGGRPRNVYRAPKGRES